MIWCIITDKSTLKKGSSGTCEKKLIMSTDSITWVEVILCSVLLCPIMLPFVKHPSDHYQQSETHTNNSLLLKLTILIGSVSNNPYQNCFLATGWVHPPVDMYVKRKTLVESGNGFYSWLRWKSQISVDKRKTLLYDSWHTWSICLQASPPKTQKIAAVITLG